MESPEYLISWKRVPSQPHTRVYDFYFAFFFSPSKGPLFKLWHLDLYFGGPCAINKASWREIWQILGKGKDTVTKMSFHGLGGHLYCVVDISGLSLDIPWALEVLGIEMKVPPNRGKGIKVSARPLQKDTSYNFVLNPFGRDTSSTLATKKAATSVSNVFTVLTMLLYPPLGPITSLEYSYAFQFMMAEYLKEVTIEIIQPVGFVALNGVLMSSVAIEVSSKHNPDGTNSTFIIPQAPLYPGNAYTIFGTSSTVPDKHYTFRFGSPSIGFEDINSPIYKTMEAGYISIVQQGTDYMYYIYFIPGEDITVGGIVIYTPSNLWTRETTIKPTFSMPGTATAGLEVYKSFYIEVINSTVFYFHAYFTYGFRIVNTAPLYPKQDQGSFYIAGTKVAKPLELPLPKPWYRPEFLLSLTAPFTDLLSGYRTTNLPLSGTTNNGSMYMFLPFTNTDTTVIDHIVLKSVDDAVIIYIDGIYVATFALGFFVLPVSIPILDTYPGKHVIAIQLVNNNTGSVYVPSNNNPDDSSPPDSIAGNLSGHRSVGGGKNGFNIDIDVYFRVGYAPPSVSNLPWTIFSNGLEYDSLYPAYSCIDYLSPEHWYNGLTLGVLPTPFKSNLTYWTYPPSVKYPWYSPEAMIGGTSTGAQPTVNSNLTFVTSHLALVGSPPTRYLEIPGYASGSVFMTFAFQSSGLDYLFLLISGVPSSAIAIYVQGLPCFATSLPSGFHAEVIVPIKCRHPGEYLIVAMQIIMISAISDNVAGTYVPSKVRDDSKTVRITLNILNGGYGNLDPLNDVFYFYAFPDNDKYLPGSVTPGSALIAGHLVQLPPLAG